MKILIAVEIASLVFMLLLAVVYYSKKRIKTYETYLYSIMLIIAIVGFVIEIINNLSALILDTNPIIPKIMGKTYLIHYAMFNIILMHYMIIKVCIKRHLSDEKIKKFILSTTTFSAVLFVVSSVFIMLLSSNVYYDGNYYFAEGATTTYIIILSALTYVIIASLVIKNFKRVAKKEKILFVVITVMYAINASIRYIKPEFTINNTIFSFIIAVMFFTIENPDIVLIEKLNKANEVKSRFLSSMSHEIKTPLNAIVGLSENGKNNLDEVKKDLKDINKQSKVLLEILSNIIDMNMISNDDIIINNRNYNLNEQILKVVNEYKQRIEDKKIQFIYEFDSSIPKVLNGDFDKINMCISKLLSNSLKYTIAGFIKVNVSCNKTDEICNLIIKVSDTGRGIDKKDHDILYKAFSRPIDDVNSVIPGIGLGLTICKKIIDKMNGTISFESKKDLGTTFKMIIPQEIVNDIKKSDEIKQVLGIKKVLIVDDNKLNIKVARKMLESLNYEVKEAYSADEAIEIVKQEDFKCIFMDIMMPEKDGIEAMHEIRELDSNKSYYIVALTADTVIGAKQSYIEEGFDDYIGKPVSVDELKRVLNDK